MKEGFDVVIPARLASTRLPGKLLQDIGGKPLIRHAYESARCSGAASVTIATDDDGIRDVASKFCEHVEMTSAAHRSGTDRVAEAVRRMGLAADRIVVNVQGDEYALPPALIDQVAALLVEDAVTGMATLCEPIRHESEWRDPNVVKVVADAAGHALYFSRAPVPWAPDGEMPARAFRHIGLYAYRAGFLLDYTSLPRSEAEQSERLEQLRALQAGHRIRVAAARAAIGIEVNAPADLERARRHAAETR